MGMISVMTNIELKWAKGRFKLFQLVLLVSLRFMKYHDKLEDIILRQNLQLREMSMNGEKLRRILQKYGQKCLLLLDGWGEHVGHSQDVLEIIKGNSLRECSVILSSRSDFVTTEISKAFQNVVKSEGFPEDYAESFAKNFLCKESEIEAVLGINIHDHKLEKETKHGSEPLYRNPALFLFVCLVLDKIDFPVHVGEIYYKVVHFLYQRYSTEKKVLDQVDHERECATWMKAVGKEALKMLKRGPYKVDRQKVVRSLGREILHWEILTDYMYKFPARTLPDEMYLTFPCFAIQELFAAFYYNEYVKHEEMDKSETHEVFGETLSKPREILNMSDMFQLFFNWLNRESEKRKE